MTREKTFAGQVCDWAGMLREVAKMGRMTLKPLTKYSYRRCKWGIVCMGSRTLRTAMTMDASSEKQKPISVHTVLNLTGLCLPSRSMRACVLSSPPFSISTMA